MFRVEQKLRQLVLVVTVLDDITDKLITCDDPLERAQLEQKSDGLKRTFEKLKSELVEAAQNM